MLGANLLAPSERRQPADTELVGADRVLAVL